MSNDNPEETINSLEKKVTTPIASLTLGLATALVMVTVLNGFLDFKVTINQMFYLQELNQATILGAVKNNRPSMEEVLPQNLEPIETNRIIVKYKEGTKLPPGLAIAAERANLERAQGLKHVFTINGIDAQVYEVDEDDTASEVVNRILATKGNIIEYAEVDMLMPPALIPNDPHYGNAWHLPKIGMPEAWDTTLGEGVIVAILDSGVNPVPDLELMDGWNFYDNNSDWRDVHGHGTRVAGASSAIGNNGVGVVGVAFNSVVMPLRVSDANGYAYFSVVSNAINYAANNGARVANVSFGNACGSATIMNAARNMRGKGGVVVVGAGNTGGDTGYSASPDITCVSATGSSDTRTSWSSFGNSIDVAAPGASIWSTNRNDTYSAVSGTSFSAPVTAGVYALLFSVNPELTPDEADAIMFSTAVDIGTAGWDIYYGHGRVDAAKAVEVAKNTKGSLDTTPPTVPANLTVTGVTSNSVSLSWSPSTDNVLVSGYNLYRNGTKVRTLTSTSVTDTNLNSATTYSYTVTAFDKAGNESAQSSAISATTNDVDFGIINHSVPSKTNNSATIAVNLTKSGTVVVNYGTRSNTLDMSVSSTNLNDTHSLNLTNLNAKTTYYYQVVATGQNGEVITSSVSNFKTSGGGGGGGGGGNPKNR